MPKTLLLPVHPERRNTNHARSRTRILVHLLAFCLATVMTGSTPHLWGQGQNTGTVNGTVTDSQGAVVPGAAVTLTSPENGYTRSVKANEGGQYVFNQVPIGTYSLKAAFAGFSDFQTTGILVDANKGIQVKAILQPPTVAAQVTVSDESGSTLDTSSATIGELIDSKLVENLPVDGGSVVALAGLLPGVVNVNAPTTFTGERGGPTFNAAGSRNTQNLMLLDGSMWNNLFYNTGLNFPPRQGIQEATVLLSNYKAQYGRNAGSVFNVLTAAGSNGFHGKVWEYDENTLFNATDYFSHQNNHLVQNQFGATMGGPIVKNKLFFFATFQNIRIATTAASTANVQSLAQRGLSAPGVPLPCSATGAFVGQNCASFVAGAATGKQSSYLKNPLYSTAYPGASDLNTAYQVAGGSGTSPCVTELSQALSTYGEYLPNSEVPSVCFNPVILNVLNKYVPLPVASSSTVEGIPTLVTAPYPRSEYDGMMRIDYQTAKHSIDARYFISDNGDLSSKAVSGSTNLGLANYEIEANSGLNNFGNIGDTWQITPNVGNVVRLGYKRYVNVQVPTDQTMLNQLGGQLQTFGPNPVLPEFNFNLFDAGSTNGGYLNSVNQDIELDDSVSWTRGKHDFLFGVTYLRLQYLNKNQYPGYIQFSTTYTGDAFADGLLGLLNTLEVANTENQGGIEHEIFGFAQDDWRVLPRLTLNLGVRYELPLVWYQPDGQSSTFVPGYQSQVFPGAPGGLAFVGDRGIPRSLINTDFDGIAPRFGVSYNLTNSGKTVLRAGFGVFFDALNANVIGVGEPFYDRFTYATPSGGASAPLQSLPAVPLSYDPKNPKFVEPASLYFPDKNFKTPYVLAFNIGVEQTLSKSASLQINYVGKFGRHNTTPIDLNPSVYDCAGAYYQVNPTLYCTGATSSGASYAARSKYLGYNYGGQGLVDFASLGTSNYNGLQVIYKQRATKSLTMLANYSYARALDVDTNGQNDNNAIPNVFNLNSQYGPSDYNVKHNLSMGWVWYLPKVSRGYGWEKSIVNNWQFNGTYQARTGLPVNLTVNDDPSLSDEPNQRPELLPGANPYLSSGRHRAEKAKNWFNPLAFGYPALGTFSNWSRNKMVGPALIQTNFTAGRTFPLGFREGTSVAFRVDAFNVFNNPVLANPNGQFSCSSSTPMIPCTSPKANSFFSQVQTTTGMNSALIGNGRKLQLSLTLSY